MYHDYDKVVVEGLKLLTCYSSAQSALFERLFKHSYRIQMLLAKMVQNRSNQVVKKADKVI